MWHGDGQLARHLTFSLVLYNKLFWWQLHQQIQVAVNISLFGPCQSIGGILCNALSTDENVNNFTKDINHFDDCHQLVPVVGFSHFDSMVDESCDEVG